MRQNETVDPCQSLFINIAGVPSSTWIRVTCGHRHAHLFWIIDSTGKFCVKVESSFIILIMCQLIQLTCTDALAKLYMCDALYHVLTHALYITFL